MAELGIDTSGWREFWEDFAATVKTELPQAKGELLEAVGERLAQEVRAAIRRSGLHDSRGRVQSWQNPHVGQGRGYVAVRPDSVEVAAGARHTSRINAGLLTEYLDQGHRVRPPSGRSARYVPRVRMARVEGRGFYAQAAKQADAIAKEEARRVLDQLAEELSE